MREVDAWGLPCPQPVLKTKEALSALEPGGRWNNNDNNCRSANRNRNRPTNRNNNNGVRLASSPIKLPCLIAPVHGRLLRARKGTPYLSPALRETEAKYRTALMRSVDYRIEHLIPAFDKTRYRHPDRPEIFAKIQSLGQVSENSPIGEGSPKETGIYLPPRRDPRSPIRKFLPIGFWYVIFAKITGRLSPRAGNPLLPVVLLVQKSAAGTMRRNQR